MLSAISSQTDANASIVAALVLSVAISVTPTLAQSTSQKSGFSMSECTALEV
jgi:hypothetical protein